MPLRCRANARLAQSQPPLGKRFRGVNRERQGVGLYRLSATADQKISLTYALQSRKHNTTYTIRFRHSASGDPSRLI